MFTERHLLQLQEIIRKAETGLLLVSFGIGLVEFGYAAAVANERRTQVYNPEFAGGPAPEVPS